MDALPIDERQLADFTTAVRLHHEAGIGGFEILPELSRQELVAHHLVGEALATRVAYGTPDARGHEPLLFNGGPTPLTLHPSGLYLGPTLLARVDRDKGLLRCPDWSYLSNGELAGLVSAALDGRPELALAVAEPEPSPALDPSRPLVEEYGLRVV